MFEFCLRNQKKKKQRILFSGFGFVSLFTNFILHTHTHTYTYTYTSTYFVTIDTTTLKYFCFKFRCSSSLLVVFVYIIDIIYIYINLFFPGFVNFSNYYYYRLCLILLYYKIYKVLGLGTYIQIFPCRAILFLSMDLRRHSSSSLAKCQ